MTAGHHHDITTTDGVETTKVDFPTNDLFESLDGIIPHEGKNIKNISWDNGTSNKAVKKWVSESLIGELDGKLRESYNIWNIM